MNKLITGCAVAASLLPTLALAVDSPDIERCMQKFTQSYFPNSRATYVAPEQPDLVVPLEANRGTHEVAVTITSAKTGRVVATGVCAVNADTGRIGSVTVSETNEE